METLEKPLNIEQPPNLFVPPGWGKCKLVIPKDAPEDFSGINLHFLKNYYRYTAYITVSEKEISISRLLLSFSNSKNEIKKRKKLDEFITALYASYPVLEVYFDRLTREQKKGLLRAGTEIGLMGLAFIIAGNFVGCAVKKIHDQIMQTVSGDKTTETHK